MEKSFEDQRQELRQKIQDLNKQERQQKAAENRAAVQKSLTPEQKTAQAANDALTVKVFNTPDGAAYLSYLKSVRPVVHDEIQEALTRAATDGTNKAK